MFIRAPSKALHNLVSRWRAIRAVQRANWATVSPRAQLYTDKEGVRTKLLFEAQFVP